MRFFSPVSRIRDIPYFVSALATPVFGFMLNLPDEVGAANNIAVQFPVPANWDGVSDITITTIWMAFSTGLVDLETQIVYSITTDESDQVTLQAFTNTNLTWVTTTKTKVLTTTILAANVAANRYFEVAFRRSTGDANTGNLTFRGASVRTGIS